MSNARAIGSAQSARRRHILKEARERSGLTQGTIAARVGPGWRNYDISDLETGRRPVDDDIFARVLHAIASMASDTFWRWLVLTLEDPR